MFRNYIKIALRNLRSSPGFTAINVFGLAVGVACCLLIGLYIADELSYDRYHENADRIHRVVLDYTTNGITRQESFTQGILGPALQREFPEVEYSVRWMYAGGMLSYEDTQFHEPGIYVVDASVFSVFTFPLVSGDPDRALAEPNSIVLTEEVAEKYFGTNEPIGQTIIWSSDRPLRVTGVMKALPAQSHFSFDALVSMSTVENDEAPSWMFGEWMSTNFQTYLLLNDPSSAGITTSKMADLMEREAGDMMRASNRWIDLRLEPLTEVYLKSNRDGFGTRGNITNLYLFGFIGAFILLIACVNFMNLATARAMQRAKEVGVRKTMGAARAQLAIQFIGEAIILSALALGVAVLMANLILPAFNELAGKSIVLDRFGMLPSGLIAVFVIIGVGLFAGSYPAFVLSGFRPIAVLKSGGASLKQGRLLRKGLVIFQFGISVALIIATGVVYAQLYFMKSVDPGFQKEQVVVVDFGGDERVLQQVDVIKSALLGQPDVLDVAASQTVPGLGIPQAGGGVQTPNGETADISAGLYMVDYDFLDLYEIETIAGRRFSEEMATDSTVAYLINETALSQLGISDPLNAIGLPAGFWGNEGRIIGVIKDFHHFGLQTRVAPLVMRIDVSSSVLFSMKLSGARMAETLAGLEAVWAELVPHRPFKFHFLDEIYGAQYMAEERFGNVFTVFACLAMFIACLGLFGLAAYTAQRRTKEIGVRKVLGASTRSILALLSRESALLVGIAFVMAVPVMHITMNRWLDTFPYRIAIPWYLYVGAGLIAVSIAWLTVSAQSFRAAMADPADTLRYE